jgi:hypothetical protein
MDNIHLPLISFEEHHGMLAICKSGFGCLVWHFTIPRKFKQFPTTYDVKRLKNNVMGVWICKVVKLFVLCFQCLLQILAMFEQLHDC